MRGLLLAGLLALASKPTQFGSLEATPRTTKQYVSYTGEPQVVAAGRRAMLVLRFRVNGGFHVNSHTPKSELLIPTRVEFEPARQVKLDAAEYPAGTPFSFPIDPTEKLDVYENEFVVRVPVVATAGEHDLKGVLRYQACDHAACFPPRALPVDLLFAAR